MASLKERLHQECRSLRSDLDWMWRIPAYVWLRIPVVFGLWAAWWALSRAIPNGFLAGPGLTTDAFFLMLADNRQDYVIALAMTLSVYLSALLIAAVVGIALGAALGSVPMLARVFSPFLHALAAMPVIALIPLIVLMLGLGWQAKVFIVGLAAFIPIMITTQAGVQSLDPELREMARAYGVSRRTRIRHFYLPAALPHIMSGLRLGAISGLVTTVIADIYTAMTGLGALLQAYGNSFRMDRYLAVVLTFAGIGAVSTGLISLIERRLTPPPLRGVRPNGDARRDDQTDLA